MGARSRRHLRSRSRWIESGAYLAVALGLGLAAPRLGSVVFPDAVTRMSASSAVGLLAAIASGMMALTGIAFSLVFVFFQLGTTAYSPRLLAELGRQRLPAHAVGIFVGTFVYAALAIRAIDLQGTRGLNMTVTWIALLWLLASVVALVMLMSSVGQVSVGRILAKLGRRGVAEAAQVYPSEVSDEAPQERTNALELPVKQLLIYRGLPQHVLGLDEAALVEAGRAAEGVVTLPYAIGDILSPGDVLASVRGSVRPVPEGRIQKRIILGRDRTVDNEPTYALRLMVDIAIRALSPAINDPTTAVMALDQIEAVLRTLGRSKLDVGCCFDSSGAVRLVYEHPTWEDILLLALSEIQQYGRGSMQVQRRMGALLSDLTYRVPESRRGPVEHLLRRWEASVTRSFPVPDERRDAAAHDRQGLGHARR